MQRTSGLSSTLCMFSTSKTFAQSRVAAHELLEIQRKVQTNEMLWEVNDRYSSGSYGKAKYFYENLEFALSTNIPWKKPVHKAMIKLEGNFGTYGKLLSKKKSYNTLEKFHIGFINVFCDEIRRKLTKGKLLWIFSNLSPNWSILPAT